MKIIEIKGKYYVGPFEFDTWALANDYLQTKKG